MESNTRPTQSGGRVSQGLHGVRERARKNKQERFTTLLQHVTPELLRESFYALKRKAAPGVDGVTWEEYVIGLEDRLKDLHSRVHRGAYRAQPSKRRWIPKANGKQRPLGIATLEDKIVQQAVVTVLNAIYEEDFRGFSYGFRPGRSQHMALDALYVAKATWIRLHTAPGLLKRPGCCCTILIRKPLRRPCRTNTAWSSPRFTRCNTVCRETPSFIVASSIGRYSGGDCSTMRARSSSVIRICHGALRELPARRR